MDPAFLSSIFPLMYLLGGAVHSLRVSWDL